MKVLLAGGGTAGHINPALAIAGYIKSRQPDAEILFAGHPKGMEARLVKDAGYAFRGVDVRGIQRKFTWKNLKYNIGAVRRIITSTFESDKIVKDFKPDIAIGTGGYISGPVIRKAAKLGVPTVIHEQNAFPGITTKMLASGAKCLMVATPEVISHIDVNCLIEITGNPLRESIVSYERETARTELGLPEGPMILSFGGSLGARKINDAVVGLLQSSGKTKRFSHIHAAGKIGFSAMIQKLDESGVSYDGTEGIWVREYIDDMPRCLAAADLVICRAGAMTLSELQAAGKASILIPSPNVAENHQYYNAMAMVNKGAASMITDADLTPDSLIRMVDSLAGDSERLAQMSRAARDSAILDSCERIYKVIMSVLKEQETE